MKSKVILKRIFTILLAIFIASPSAVQSRPKGVPYSEFYEDMLVKHFGEVYFRYHMATWNKYFTEYDVTKLPVADRATVNERIKKFKAQEMVTIKGTGTRYELHNNVKLGYMEKHLLINRGRLYPEQVIGWDDNHYLHGLAEIVFGGGKWHVTPVSHSIAKPMLYPEEWRPWFKDPIDLEEKVIPYCGIVDDDLMYDFREENPFKAVLTHNKQSPFIYVYDFNLLRERMQEWTVHDTLLHGWRAFGKEEEENPARLEYGPVLGNANHPALRAIRVQIFLKMYLAKLRLAKLLHPAPKWIEEKGDYTTMYGGGDTEEWVKKIDPSNIVRNGTPLKTYLDLLLKAPNEAYFLVLSKDIAIPTDVGNALKSKDWSTIKREAYLAQAYEMMRDLYLHKMFVRSPEQVAIDLKAYRTNRWLSIALWSGMSSASIHKHQFIGGIKHYYPFFERKDKRGNTHLSNARPKYFAFHGMPTNTAGLVYAGHMTDTELLYYCLSTGKSVEQVWDDALKGPFMTVSSRTYDRYGHGHFEKLAGHKLKKVDVTGALLDSISRVWLHPDPDLVRQLLDMDYFYYKAGPSDSRGSITMKTVASMSLTKVIKVPESTYDPIQAVRNPTANHAVKPGSMSTVFCKDTRAYANIFKDIADGLAKDEKQFPGMSIRMVNYLPYHTKYPDPMYIRKEYQLKSARYPGEGVRNWQLLMHYKGEPVRYPRPTYLCEVLADIVEDKTITNDKMVVPWSIFQYTTIPTNPGAAKEVRLSLQGVRVQWLNRVLMAFPGFRRAPRAWVKGIEKYMPGVKNFRSYSEKEQVKISRDYFITAYFGMPRTPRHIEFLEEIARMKREGVVEKVKSTHELQLLIWQRVPWMAMNPNMFMAYYKHIDKLEDVFDKLTGDDAYEEQNGTADGHFVWHRSNYMGTGDAILAALGDKITSQTNYMLIAYGYIARPKGYTMSAVAGGRMRKLPSEKGAFPEFVRKFSYSYCHNLSTDFYEHPYIWMLGTNGYPLMLRDPEWFMTMGTTHGTKEGVDFYAKLMPGMTRFVNADLITIPLRSYTGVWWPKARYDHGIYPTLSGWMVEREYDTRTCVWTDFQALVAGNYKIFSLANEEAFSRKYLAEVSATTPQESSAFVITNGIVTTVTKVKGLVNEKYVAALYSGLEKL